MNSGSTTGDIVSEDQGDGGLECEGPEGDGDLECEGPEGDGGLRVLKAMVVLCEGPEGDKTNTGGSVEEYSGSA